MKLLRRAPAPDRLAMGEELLGRDPRFRIVARRTGAIFQLAALVALAREPGRKNGQLRSPGDGSTFDKASATFLE